MIKNGAGKNWFDFGEGDRKMGSKGRRGRDICLDEGEEGIGKEERTFAQDLLYGLCKNHQTGTADKSCIPSSPLRMFTFAEAKEKRRKTFFERKKTEEFGNSAEKSFWKSFE